MEACEAIEVASDKDRAIAGSPLHTNFHLDRNGETIFLVNPNGTTIEFREHVARVGLNYKFNWAPAIIARY